MQFDIWNCQYGKVNETLHDLRLRSHHHWPRSAFRLTSQIWSSLRSTVYPLMTAGMMCPISIYGGGGGVEKKSQSISDDLRNIVDYQHIKTFCKISHHDRKTPATFKHIHIDWYTYFQYHMKNYEYLIYMSFTAYVHESNKIIANYN